MYCCKRLSSHQQHEAIQRVLVASLGRTTKNLAGLLPTFETWAARQVGAAATVSYGKFESAIIVDDRRGDEV